MIHFPPSFICKEKSEILVQYVFFHDVEPKTGPWTPSNRSDNDTLSSFHLQREIRYFSYLQYVFSHDVEPKTGPWKPSDRSDNDRPFSSLHLQREIRYFSYLQYVFSHDVEPKTGPWTPSYRYDNGRPFSFLHLQREIRDFSYLQWRRTKDWALNTFNQIRQWYTFLRPSSAKRNQRF